MADIERLKQLVATTETAAQDPDKLFAALAHIVDLGYWGTGTAASRPVWEPGTLLIEDAASGGSINGQTKLVPAPVAGGTVPAVRASRDPFALVWGVLGSTNTYQERRALGLLELVPEENNYPSGTHRLRYANGQYKLGIHQDALEGLRRLPKGLILGGIDFFAADADNFPYGLQAEPDRLSTYPQTTVAHLPLAVGVLQALAEDSMTRKLTTPTVPRS